MGAVLPPPPPPQALGELLSFLAAAGLVGHFQASKRANWLKKQCSDNGRWGGERPSKGMKGTLLSPSSQPLTHASRSGRPRGRAGTGHLPVGGAQTPPEKHSTDLICSHRPFSSTRPPALELPGRFTSHKPPVLPWALTSPYISPEWSQLLPCSSLSSFHISASREAQGHQYLPT